MDQITDMKAIDCQMSIYVKPFRLSYKQNGISKTWDVMMAHNSVSILLFNSSRSVVVLVKQFRPAVYYDSIPPEDRTGHVDSSRYPGSLGVTLELCAGILDKDLPLEEIAREEVLEECGYDVPSCSLQKIVTFQASVGISGSEQTMFYVEVTDAMKVSGGGGNAAEGEFIEVVEMSIPQVRQYLERNDVCSPSGLLYAFAWFLNKKAPAFEKHCGLNSTLPKEDDCVGCVAPI